MGVGRDLREPRGRLAPRTATGSCSCATRTSSPAPTDLFDRVAELVGVPASTWEDRGGLHGGSLRRWSTDPAFGFSLHPDVVALGRVLRLRRGRAAQPAGEPHVAVPPRGAPRPAPAARRPALTRQERPHQGEAARRLVVSARSAADDVLNVAEALLRREVAAHEAEVVGLRRPVGAHVPVGEVEQRAGVALLLPEVEVEPQEPGRLGLASRPRSAAPSSRRTRCPRSSSRRRRATP